MKTYNRTIASPILEISYDEDSESPRNWDGNMGYFFTKEKNYKSPDGISHPIYEAMIETEDDAKNSTHHIELIKKCVHQMFKSSAPKDGNSHNEDLHIIDIFPVYRYEHGAVSYKRGTAHGFDYSNCGFDYSNCGFYIVTAQSLSGGTHTTEDIKKAIDIELETYTTWTNGSVYRFVLYDKNGEVADSCGGFYEIEHIREHLPKEWKKEDLNQYIK